MFPNEPTNTQKRVNLSDIAQEYSDLSPEDRFTKGLELLPEVLDRWEKDHPEWRIEVLLWILDGALHSLRNYIEAPEEPEISWDSPYVELHFPVECTWEDGDADYPQFHLNAGRLEKAQMADADTAIQALAKIMVSYLEIMALQDLTNGRALEKHGEVYKRILDSEAIEELEKIESPEDQEKELQKLFQPLSFGAGYIDYGDLEKDGYLGEDIEAQLTAILPPLIKIPFEANGFKMQLIAILEINPLIADPETKSAYFPIVVGLAVQFFEYPTEDVDVLHALNSVGLPEWPEQDRLEIWDTLHNVLQNILEELNPDPEEEMVEAVLSINAQIKFMVPKNDPSRFNQTISHTLDHFKASGEILSIEFKRGDPLLPNPADANRMNGLLSAVENATTPLEKGVSLENLVSALFASIPAFEVFDRVRTRSEEIDIWIANTSNDRPFRDETNVILAECKNWMGKCGKNEFVLLREKVANRSGRCGIAFLVSWNGFAETITTEMLRGSRETHLIVPIDGNSIREAVSTGDFLQVITTARQKALMI